MYRYRTHLVTGTPVQLSNVIANHRTAGTLVAVGDPRPASGGRLAVEVRLIDTTPTPSPTPSTRRVHRPGEYAATRVRRRNRRARRVALAAGASAIVVAGLAYVVYLLVQLIAAYWPLILGVAVIALIAAGTGRAAAAHCQGCPR